MSDAVPSRLGLMTRLASLMALYSHVDNLLVSPNSTSSTYKGYFTQDLAEALPTTLDQQQSSDLHNGMSAHQTTWHAISDNIIRPILEDLISTDRSKGVEVLKSWRNYYHVSATAPPISGTTTSLEDHLYLYVHTFPKKAWMVTLRYALGLHFQETELEAMEPAIEAAIQSVALTRDYWTWPKDSYSTDNNKRVNNSVAVSMVENQCSEAQAMAIVKKAAIAAESKFLARKLEVLEAIGKEHSEVTMFLDAMEHFAAGNSLWCSTCPLYHRLR